MTEKRIIENQNAKESNVVYCCSDLHCMDGGPRDDFASLLPFFLESLKKIETYADIILVGDIFDCWRIKKISRIFEYYRELISILSPYNPILVVGNHEGKIENVQEYLPPEWTVCEKTMWHGWYISHGHEWDWKNRKNRSLGRAATRLVSWLGRINPDWEDGLSLWPSKIQKIGRFSDRARFKRGCERDMEHWHGCRGVICGHTHFHETDVLLGRKNYINCGTWYKNGWLKFINGEFVGLLE